MLSKLWSKLSSFSPRQDVPQKRTNLITPTGYKKLVDELTLLVKSERPQVVEEVHHAAKQGDRSENAEYQYGKKRLREIDKRVRFLTRKIDSARIVDPREQRSDIVLFGATVTVEKEDGTKKIYQIVGEDEIETLKGKISWKSPLGRGLLNTKAGDFVSIEVPAGIIELLIVDIKYF